MIIGYYVFLGHGDYHAPIVMNNKWSASWNINDWKSFIDKLITLDVNTLMIYMNGHNLPYASTKFPALVDRAHPNVSNNFLPEILLYAKKNGLQIIAVLTTTGHAGSFAALNTAAKIEPSMTNEVTEDLLMPFPIHLRKGKLLKKDGAAQLGHGVLCHNKKIGSQYAEIILNEIIDIYGQYFDGIALHPPETASPCYCEHCQQKFLNITHQALHEVDVNIVRRFFIHSYLEFQSNVLCKIILDKLPHIKLLTFTIPWLFESAIDDISSSLAKYNAIIEWDYNLEPERLASLSSRLKKYKMICRDLWFMPTAGFSFDSSQDITMQITALQQQLTIVNETSVDAIVHFLGPKVSEHLLETSVQMLLDNKITYTSSSSP